MDIEIRRADISDLDLLMQWRMTVLREVFSIPSDEPMEELYRANLRYYQKAIPEGSHIACFAADHQKIIGCGGVCLYSEMPSPDNTDGSCGYLMNIYTSPESRKRGVGRQIVEWLISECRKRGVQKIYLEASEKGYPLYRELGFRDMEGYVKLS